MRDRFDGILGRRTTDERAAQAQARSVVIHHLPDLCAFGPAQARMLQVMCVVRTIPRTLLWIGISAILVWAIDGAGRSDWAQTAVTVLALISIAMAVSAAMRTALEVARVPFADFDWCTYLRNHQAGGEIPSED